MIVEISPEAARLIGQRGGRLWVWAAYPRLCCSSGSAWMHAATEAPAGLSGFSLVTAPGAEVFFRGLGDLRPATLEVGVRGKRHPRVEAYWDGCLMALT